MTATNVIYPLEFQKCLGASTDHCPQDDPARSQLAGGKSAPTDTAHPSRPACPSYSDVSAPTPPVAAPAQTTHSSSLGSEVRPTPAEWFQRFLLGVLVGLCCIIISTYLVDHLLPKAIGQFVYDANLNDSFY